MMKLNVNHFAYDHRTEIFINGIFLTALFSVVSLCVLLPIKILMFKLFKTVVNALHLLLQNKCKKNALGGS